MKSRDYKDFVPDNYYHIFNRGNAKMNIFLDEEDYKFFMLRLEENLFPERFKKTITHLGKGRRAPSVKLGKYIRRLLPSGSFSLVCYCLMPNHFHLLIRQNYKVKISALMLRVCGSYAKYFNKKYDRVGSIFQDQFKAVLVGKNNYLLWLSAYIHKNPEVGKFVSDPKKWKWSSYSDFVGQEKAGLCDKDVILKQLSVGKYENLVKQDFEKNEALKLNIFLLNLE
jgi:putative transposase